MFDYDVCYPDIAARTSNGQQDLFVNAVLPAHVGAITKEADLIDLRCCVGGHLPVWKTAASHTNTCASLGKTTKDKERQCVMTVQVPFMTSPFAVSSAFTIVR
jgi:hypothetical protein